jgi:molybdopterin-containing oxidoreductase family membrane subunit
VNVLRVTSLLNLFMVGSEVFTEFYTGGSHTASAQYLYFGLHGHNALVPWIWSAIVMNVTAAWLFNASSSRTQLWRLDIACLLALAGVWIEKGIGLIVPAFVPSTLHELVEYLPSMVEWKVTLGIWAFGLLLFTVGVKLAVAVFSGEMRMERGT